MRGAGKSHWWGAVGCLLFGGCRWLICQLRQAIDCSTSHATGSAQIHAQKHTCTSCLSLPSINLKVKPGQLVAIVGQVGAGKSSLLSAMLGEMERVQGNVSVRVRGGRGGDGEGRPIFFILEIVVADFPCA